MSIWTLAFAGVTMVAVLPDPIMRYRRPRKLRITAITTTTPMM
jgi:hypothetical protein